MIRKHQGIVTLETIIITLLVSAAAISILVMMTHRITRVAPLIIDAAISETGNLILANLSRTCDDINSRIVDNRKGDDNSKSKDNVIGKKKYCYFTQNDLPVVGEEMHNVLEKIKDK